MILLSPVCVIGEMMVPLPNKEKWKKKQFGKEKIIDSV
jgi:hypothetical protein